LTIHDRARDVIRSGGEGIYSALLENESMAAKGARQALILMNDTAFVLAVPKRTVITVLDGEHAKDNIFTNIDSAAIL